jgi:hypothetical protein
MTAKLSDLPLRKKGKPVPKYVTVEAHLSLDELAHRYRKAVDPVERSHFHISWLLAQGKRVSEVALVTGYCPNWIRILARRYNQDGAQVLADQRKQNTGAPALLSDEQKINYANCLSKPHLMTDCGQAQKSLIG